jgi:arylformamidase
MKNDWFFLSHTLDVDTPGFGGTKGFSRDVLRSINSGDSSNSELWTFNNHVGSHVDSPRHFSSAGPTISDYAASHWIFDHVTVLSIATKNDEIISPDAWCDGIPNDCELLLLKTGFEAVRSEEAYWKHNPGLSPDLATWLRAHRPSVRSIGFDFISLTAFQHRALGREAHQAFLRHITSPILIFEDLKLSACGQNLTQVIALPLMVKNGDGGPVTVVGRQC